MISWTVLCILAGMWAGQVIERRDARRREERGWKTYLEAIDRDDGAGL